MTITPQPIGEPGRDTLADRARDHLWMHFTRHSTYAEGGHVPVIVSGEGAYIFDDQGKRYLDGLAGLFVVQVGHGRQELADVAAMQARELAFFPLWSYAHPRAIELADRLAGYAPGDLNRVFFTTGGGGKQPPEFCTGSRNTAATVSGPSNSITSAIRSAAHRPNDLRSFRRWSGAR